MNVLKLFTLLCCTCFYLNTNCSRMSKYLKVLNVFSPGDEVVEWNGRCLQRATFEEVRDIIMESKQEPEVELIVHRGVRYVITVYVML